MHEEDARYRLQLALVIIELLRFQDGVLPAVVWLICLEDKSIAGQEEYE